MKYLPFYLIAVFLTAAVLTGCEHDDTPEDPNLIDRFGPFRVDENLSADRESVDFSQGQTVTFTAEFNKNVDWVIRIEGLESGAVKRIEGFDRLVGPNNAVWDGGTTDLPFFKEENCLVTFRVPEEPEFGDTLEISVEGLKAYGGSLLSDFEDAPGSNIIVRDFQFELNLGETGRRDANVIPPAQGDFSLVITGSDNAQDPFVGLIEVYAALSGNTYMQLPSNVPGSTYFNCFIYSDGRPHAIAILDLVIDSNDNGVFNEDQDALYSTGPIPVTWTGWRQYSLSLADFGISESEMDRILLSRVVLINDIANNPNDTGPPDEIQFGVDFMTFTQGGPLQL